MTNLLAARDTLAKVLSEHYVAIWSDGTFACSSCATRYERDADPFVMSEYVAISKPDWDHREACNHLADALLVSGVVVTDATGHQ